MILSILLTCVLQTIVFKHQMARQDNNFVCILYPEILFTKTSLGFNDSSTTWFGSNISLKPLAVCFMWMSKNVAF